MIDVENGWMEVLSGGKVEWRRIASWESVECHHLGSRRPMDLLTPVPATSEYESVQWVVGSDIPVIFNWRVEPIRYRTAEEWRAANLNSHDA